MFMKIGGFDDEDSLASSPFLPLALRKRGRIEVDLFFAIILK
jgi:hypothetical protein